MLFTVLQGSETSRKLCSRLKNDRIYPISFNLILITSDQNYIEISALNTHIQNEILDRLVVFLKIKTKCQELASKLAFIAFDPCLEI